MSDKEKVDLALVCEDLRNEILRNRAEIAHLKGLIDGMAEGIRVGIQQILREVGR